MYGPYVHVQERATCSFNAIGDPIVAIGLEFHYSIATTMEFAKAK